MSLHHRSSESLRSHPLIKVLHVSASVIAIGYFVFVLSFTVLANFSEGVGLGLRSLAAAALPLLLAFYLGFLSRVKVPTNRSRAPLINNFILFIFWTALIMGLIRTIETGEFPLLELLYSLTLAAVVWRYRQSASFSALAACSYGIICGGLFFTVVFGWPQGG